MTAIETITIFAVFVRKNVTRVEDIVVAIVVLLVANTFALFLEVLTGLFFDAVLEIENNETDSMDVIFALYAHAYPSPNSIALVVASSFETPRIIYVFQALANSSRAAHTRGWHRR
jgi:hypothetical protein